jgi:hypothetical protein
VQKSRGAQAFFSARRDKFRFRLPQPDGESDPVAAIRIRFPEKA